MNQIYRQGDVLIRAVADSEVPAELKPVERDKGRVVLAYGEVTGHAHAIRHNNAHLFVETKAEKPRTFLRVVKPEGKLHTDKNSYALLRHEEHAPVKLAPGAYEIVHQREYHPEEIRNVAD